MKYKDMTPVCGVRVHAGNSSRHRFRQGFAVTLALAILAVVAAVPPYLTDLAANMNSDQLTLPDLYESLVRRNEAWSSWCLGGAPFFFPDIALFFPVAAVVGDTYLAHLLQTGLYVLTLMAGFWARGRARAGRYADWATSWALVLFLLITHPRVWPQAADLWKVIYHPFAHGGAALLAVAGMLLVFSHLKRGRRWALFFLAVVCVGGGASDLLFCLYFSIPSLLSLTVLAVLHRFRRQRVSALFLTILLATLLGRMLIPWIRPGQQAEHLYLSRTGIGTACNTVLFMVRDLVFQHHWMFLFSAVVSLTVATWLGIRLVRMLLRKTPFSWRVCYLDQCVVWSLAGGWAALLATGNYVDTGSWRYLVFPSALAIVMAVWAAALRMPRWMGGLGVAVFLMICLGHGFSKPNLQRPYPELARFLDAYGQDKPPLVLGDYWTARQTTFLSRNGVRVEQICANGRIYHWANSLDTYRRIREEPGRHGIIIMDRLDPAQIRAAFGDPTEERYVGKNLVYFYLPPRSVQLVRFLQGGLP